MEHASTLVLAGSRSRQAIGAIVPRFEGEQAHAELRAGKPYRENEVRRAQRQRLPFSGLT